MTIPPSQKRCRLAGSRICLCSANTTIDNNGEDYSERRREYLLVARRLALESAESTKRN